MTVEEVKKEKRALAKEIELLIFDFSIRSGVTVDSIDLSSVVCIANGPIYDVSIKVEL
jgi:hypothetical protein